MRQRQHVIVRRATWRLSIEVVPQDAWVGVYWRSIGNIETGRWERDRFDLYVCVVPFVPIHFRWWRLWTPTKADIDAARNLTTPPAERGRPAGVWPWPIPDIARGG